MLVSYRALYSDLRECQHAWLSPLSHESSRARASSSRRLHSPIITRSTVRRYPLGGRHRSAYLYRRAAMRTGARRLCLLALLCTCRRTSANQSLQAFRAGDSNGASRSFPGAKALILVCSYSTPSYCSHWKTIVSKGMGCNIPKCEVAVAIRRRRDWRTGSPASVRRDTIYDHSLRLSITRSCLWCVCAASLLKRISLWNGRWNRHQIYL